MTILEQIMLHKREEVTQQQRSVNLSHLREMPYYERDVVSFKESIRRMTFGIVAEFKRKSPSKGLINGVATPVETASNYEQAGVAAMSILTDSHFFGGSSEDLKAVREIVKIPLLRKDFMLDEYQLHEAKAWGADVILLIAAALPPSQLKELAAAAHSLGLEVLLEVHNLEELEACICDEVDVVGVNNRNLKTFEVEIATSIELAKHIPSNFLKISESGISQAKTIFSLHKHGFEGFLMGENFMKQQNPGEACKVFLNSLKEKG